METDPRVQTSLKDTLSYPKIKHVSTYELASFQPSDVFKGVSNLIKKNHAGVLCC